MIPGGRGSLLTSVQGDQDELELCWLQTASIWSSRKQEEMNSVHFLVLSYNAKQRIYTDGKLIVKAQQKGNLGLISHVFWLLPSQHSTMRNWTRCLIL